jgi:RNA polymerase sigma-70 factor (ECF subfamily)
MAQASNQARKRLRALMQRLGNGDRSAFPAIYEATKVKLFGICLRILGDQSEAEDALQDVYANLLRSADRYDPDRASPISWLATLARNRAVDRARKGGVRAHAAPIDEAGALPDGVPLADEQLIDGERDARVHSCIETLSENQRRPIREAFFGGRTYDEIAHAEDVPPGTMRSRIRRGLMRLRDCMEDGE